MNVVLLEGTLIIKLRVCMDQVIVYLGKNKICKEGDISYYIKNNLHPFKESDVTKRNNTISYTIFTSLTSRPKRVAKIFNNYKY
jgi:alanine racemase